MKHRINGNISRYPVKVVKWAKEKFAYNRFTGKLFDKETGKELGSVERRSPFNRARRPGISADSAYAIVSHTPFGKLRSHNIIMMLELGYCPMVVDHRDHDGTNNTWTNLVFAGADGAPMSPSRNAAQTRRPDRPYPRFISCNKSRKKPFRVRIQDLKDTGSGKAVYIGSFATVTEAVDVRNTWLLKNRDLTALTDDVITSIQETTGRQLLAA